MGHCYDASTGSMICDRCSEPGARTRRCAFGYCPGADLCGSCWAIEKPGWRRLHKEQHCEEAHERNCIGTDFRRVEALSLLLRAVEKEHEDIEDQREARQ